MTAPFVRRISRRALAGAALLVGTTATLGRSAQSQYQPVASPQVTPAFGRPTLLLRIESFGETTPPEMQLIAMPMFSLFDDGSIYRLGPVIAIYPPPALPNVTRMRISLDAVTAIMERARDAGLDQARDVPNPSMSDGVASIRIRFNDDGQFVDSTTWGLFTDVGLPPAWDEETLAAYEALRDIVSFLVNVPTNLSAGDLLEPEIPVDPERLQVVSFVATPDLTLPSLAPDLQQPPLTWPLSTPLAAISTPYDAAAAAGLPEPGCIEISGADARAVVATAREGNLLSPWIDGDVTYGLLLKPLLPDQTGCSPIDAS
jgi:hypothetical protein